MTYKVLIETLNKHGRVSHHEAIEVEAASAPAALARVIEEFRADDNVDDWPIAAWPASEDFALRTVSLDRNPLLNRHCEG